MAVEIERYIVELATRSLETAQTIESETVKDIESFSHYLLLGSVAIILVSLGWRYGLGLDAPWYLIDLVVVGYVKTIQVVIVPESVTMIASSRRRFPSSCATTCGFIGMSCSVPRSSMSFCHSALPVMRLWRRPRHDGSQRQRMASLLNAGQRRWWATYSRSDGT